MKDTDLILAEDVVVEGVCNVLAYSALVGDVLRHLVQPNLLQANGSYIVYDEFETLSDVVPYMLSRGYAWAALGTYADPFEAFRAATERPTVLFVREACFLAAVAQECLTIDGDLGDQRLTIMGDLTKILTGLATRYHETWIDAANLRGWRTLLWAPSPQALIECSNHSLKGLVGRMTHVVDLGGTGAWRHLQEHAWGWFSTDERPPAAPMVIATGRSILGAAPYGHHPRAATAWAEAGSHGRFDPWEEEDAIDENLRIILNTDIEF
jgi:hypothetical protein